MSRIIAFAWTTPALLAGAKTCTRRDWDPAYAQSFKEGQEVFAYNRSPRARGVHVATLRLTQKPRYEPLVDMPDSDYDCEGFRWYSNHPESLTKTVEGMPRNHFIEKVCSWEGFLRWRHSGESMYTVRFELLDITPDGESVKRSLEALEAHN